MPAAVGYQDTLSFVKKISTYRETPSFQFVLNKEEANQQLQEAEQRDLYLAECRDNRANSKARRSCTYAANHVSFDDGQHYQQWLQDAIPALPLRLRTDLGSIRIIPLTILPNNLIYDLDMK